MDKFVGVFPENRGLFYNKVLLHKH